LFQGLNYRDTDWFEVNIDEYSQITLTAVAEFPVLLFIIDSGSGVDEWYCESGFGLDNNGILNYISA